MLYRLLCRHRATECSATCSGDRAREGDLGATAAGDESTANSAEAAGAAGITEVGNEMRTGTERHVGERVVPESAGVTASCNGAVEFDTEGRRLRTRGACFQDGSSAGVEQVGLEADI